MFSILFQILIYGDIPYTDVSRYGARLFELWSTESLGTVSRQSLGGLRDFILMKMSFSDYLFHFYKYYLPIFLIPIVYYYVLGRLGIKNVAIRAIISILPVFSPVFFGDFLTGQTFWVYLTLPVLYWLVIEMYYSKLDFRRAASIALMLFLTFGFLPPIIVPLVLVLTLLCLPPLLFNIKNLRYVFKYLGLSFLIAALFGLMVLPFFVSAPSGQEAYKSASAINDYLHNYSKTQLDLTLRLAGNAGSGQQTLGYNEPSMTNSFGYLLFFLILTSFFFRNRRKFEVVSLLAVFLITIGVMHVLSTNRELGSYLFNSQWIITSIRNPTKIYVVLLPIFTFLVAFSADSISSKIREPGFYKAAFVVALAASIGIYGWPTLRGDFGLFYGKAFDANFYVKDNKIIEIAERANNSPGRSILIPTDHHDELNFQNISPKLSSIRLSGNLPSTSVLTRDIINSFNNQSSSFSDYLYISNITNIFLKKDMKARDPFVLFPSRLTFEEAVRFLLSNGFSVSYENGDYVQFTTPAKPFVYSPDRINYLPNPTVEQISAMNSKIGTTVSSVPEESLVLVDQYSSSTQPSFDVTQKAILYDPALIQILVTRSEEGRWVFERKDPVNFETVSIAQMNTDPSIRSFILDGQIYTVEGDSETITVRSGSHKLEFLKMEEISAPELDLSFENSRLEAGDAQAGEGGDSGVFWEFINDSTDGARAALLGSNNHSAFLQKKLPALSSKKLYYVTFSYKHVKGRDPSFAVWQEDLGIASPKGNLSPNGNQWSSFDTFVRTTSDSGDAYLYLYSNADPENPSGDIFDNVRVYEAVKGLTHTFDLSSYKAYMSVVPTNRQASLGAENLIKNSSFEETGSWSEVGDAQAGSPGEAKLFSRTSYDSVDGDKSISLHALNHTAFISQKIDSFDPNLVYKLSFYYKNASGAGPSYAIWQSGVNLSFPRAGLDKDSQWRYYEQYFVPDGNASGMELYLYSASQGGATVNQFDDVRLEKFSYIKDYLTLKDAHDAEPHQIVKSFQRDRPSVLRVDLEKPAAPGLVAFAESYHSGWRAFLKPKDQKNLSALGRLLLRAPGKEINSKNHVMVDGYANGWWLNPADFGSESEYELVLEYWPQRYVYLVLLFSGLVMAFCLATALLWRRHESS